MTSTTNGTAAEYVPNPLLTTALLRIAAMEWQRVPPAVVAESSEAGFGHFTGLPAQIEKLAAREWRLLRALTYFDASGADWPVPVGAWLDGASIPRAFWTIIGGPFEGDYVEASIVHDHYCIVKTRSWAATHRMFYEAMRRNGVGKAKAKVMYYAVYRFGPRWTLAEAGLAEASAGSRIFDVPDEAVPSLAADAEAIYVQDLNLDEIEILANARNAELAAWRPELESASETGSMRARLLVVPGGSGNEADIQAVADEAVRLPLFATERFEETKIRLVACRGNVTDFETGLRDIVPRGWKKTGKTWNDVPGAYFPDRKRVVIATIASGASRVVPDASSRLHGSSSLVVHESLHGFDYIGGHAALADQRFTAARNRDHDKLGAYEQQEGQPGLEETFAESGARFIADNDALLRDWPSLHAYWQEGPYRGMMPETGPVESTGEAIGIAERLADGTIEMDLRAESASGAIGHAFVRVSREDPAYEELNRHIYGLGTDRELSPSGPVLFIP